LTDVYQRGDRLDLPGVDFASSAQTLVLALNLNCQYCDESVPFYKALVAGRTTPVALRVIAVLPAEREESQPALAKKGLHPDQLIDLPLSQLRIRGTPTVLLVDRHAMVQAVWQGRLDAKRQQEVREAINVRGRNDVRVLVRNQ
jgi:hypothetical protein